MKTELTKDKFLELSENRKKYKLLRKLPGKLSYAEIGDRFYSETLYENDYNMIKLVDQGYLTVVDEPFDFQKEVIGKNIKTVYVKCGECGTWGINEPLDIVCGICGYTKCVTYYDAETINDYIASSK